MDDERGDSTGDGSDVRAAVFAALADPIRRLILDELAERDGQSLFELCGRLLMRHGVEISRQGVTKHLDVLAAAGLLGVERSGRTRIHRLERAPLEGLLDRWMTGAPASAEAAADEGTA